MTDSELSAYTKKVHDDIYAMSTPMIDGMAVKVLTRLRKEQRNLFPINEEWNVIMSIQVDVMDILTIAVRRGVFTADDCNKFMHDAIVINDGKFPVAKYEDYRPARNLDEFCTPLP